MNIYIIPNLPIKPVRETNKDVHRTIVYLSLPRLTTAKELNPLNTYSQKERTKGPSCTLIEITINVVVNPATAEL